MKSTGILGCVLALIALSEGSSPLGIPTTEPFNNSLTVDADGNYVVYWNYNTTHVTFEVHVKTRGFVGFGLSPNGNMFPADVVVGWVKNGKIYFKDYHTVAKASPIVDNSQDWLLLHGEENDAGTLLKFVRKIDTCDSDDIVINEATQRIIYSYHPDDPQDENSLMYHGADRRGTKSVSLLKSSQPPVSYGNDDTKVVDITAGNYIVPAKDTTYLCIGFQMPDIGGKHHMIEFEPIFTPGNERLLHHLTMQRCKGPRPDLHMKRGECLDKPKPDGFPDCPEFVLAWAAGGGPFYFPEDTGFSVGAPDDLSFYMMQVHYDNPGLKAEVIDNSGIRMHITPTLRQHDVGSLILGSVVSPMIIIPPGEPDYLSSGYCSESCLAEGFAKSSVSEITFVAALQHAHLLAKKIKTRHFRNGTELRPLMDDPNYDFYFQEYRPLVPEVVVKPGDRFVVECTYDSTKRTNTSFGGFTTRDEMCETIVYHYPKLSLMSCSSYPLFEAAFANGYLTDGAAVEKYRQHVDAMYDLSDPVVKANFTSQMADINYFNLCIGLNSTTNGYWVSYNAFKEDKVYTPYIPPKPTYITADSAPIHASWYSPTSTTQHSFQDTDCFLTWNYSIEKAVCPDKWYTFEGQSYFICPALHLNFTEAKEFCSNHSATLIHIDDQTENDFVVGKIKEITRSTHQHLWIGLTDLAEGSVYRWVDDNSTASYTNWYSSNIIGLQQPSHGTYEHCVALDFGFDYKWNDIGCGGWLSPLCEKRSVQTSPINVG